MGIFLWYLFVPYKVNIPVDAGGFKQVQCKEYICWIQVKIHISDQTSLRICNSVYKSLTDTWMWKLGLWLRNSFSGKICFEYSVLVFCRALTANNFTFMYSQKRFCQASLLISTRHFQNRIIMFRHELWYSAGKYSTRCSHSAFRIGKNIFPNWIMKFQ